MRPRLVLGGLAAALGLIAAGAAQAQHGPPPEPSGKTFDLQGSAQHRWGDSPHWRAFYELTRTSFADGWNRVDFPTYQEKSFAIFREFGKSIGWGPEVMVDHLKAIPGQMLQIVGDDPHALDSYESFHTAVMGPP